MAEAPGIQDALARERAEQQRDRDLRRTLQAQLATVDERIAARAAKIADYQSYVDFKATQP